MIIQLRFEIYDVDDENDLENLKSQEIIGIVEIPFNDLVLSAGEILPKDIQPHLVTNKKSKKNLGKINIKATESDICQSRIKFSLVVEEMQTRNNIMITLKGSSNNKEYFWLHDTPKKKNTSKGCSFPEFSINSNKIADESSNIKFEFYEIKKNLPKLLGELEISLISLYNNNGTKISIFRNTFVVGKLRATLRKDDNNNFLNYIYDGYSLKVIVAIDYCAKPRMTGFGDGQGDLSSNKTVIAYKQALLEVGELLKCYDDDPRTVVLGFGAKLEPYYNVVSHCFALNGDYFNPEQENLAKIPDSIINTLSSVQLHGPKIISEVIKYSMDIASFFKEKYPK
jgi:hypothetical protein